jgi:hypothetical protein
MYYPFMDYYITELTARLLENDGRYQAQYLIPMNLPRLTPDTVDVIFDTDAFRFYLHEAKPKANAAGRGPIIRPIQKQYVIISLLS